MSMSCPTRFRANDLYPSDVEVLLDVFQQFCHVREPDQCWLWTGKLNRDGYGVVSHDTRQGVGGNLAHRIAWVLASRSPLTGDLTVDHLCRNVRCVNPAHLEPVPVEENIRRMMSARPTTPRRSTVRQTTTFEADASNRARRVCPTCRVAYDRRYIAAHVRRMHPEAA